MIVVDVHVLGAGVLTDDHAGVDLHAGGDEQLPSLLEVEQGELGCLPRPVGDQGPVGAGAQLALPRLVAVEDMVEDAGATGFGEELRAKTDQPARRDPVLEPHPARRVVDHLLHAAFAQPQQLADHADVVLGHVDGQVLEGLLDLPFDLAGDHPWLAYGELEPLASHRLHQHRELQFPAALHLPGVGTFRGQHAQGDVADQFLLEPGLDQPGRELFAIATSQGGGVDPERHPEARFVHGQARQGTRVVDGGKGVADGHLVDAGDRDQVARAGLVGLHAVQRLGQVQLGELDPLHLAVLAAPGNRLTAADVAVLDPAQGQAAEIGGGVEVGDQGLEGMIGHVGRRGDVGQDGVEQRCEVGPGYVGVQGCGAVTGVGVEHGQVDLRVIGAEVDQQAEGFVHHLGDAGVGTVDLVDHHDDGKATLQGLAQHEAGLRQGAFARVDQQQRCVHHGQRPLHLAAEVGVTGGVHHVDGDVVLTGPGDDHGGVLRQDGDPALTFEVAGVHHPLVDVLVGAERPGLPEHGIDKGGLAVVDVGDDGDVAQVRTDRGRGSRHGHTEGVEGVCGRWVGKAGVAGGWGRQVWQAGVAGGCGRVWKAVRGRRSRLQPDARGAEMGSGGHGSLPPRPCCVPVGSARSVVGVWRGRGSVVVRNRPRVAVWWHRSGYEGVVVYGTGHGWLSGGIDPATGAAGGDGCRPPRHGTGPATKALWCTEPAAGGRLVAPIRPPAPQGATGVHGRRRPPLTWMVRPPWPRRSRPGSGAGRPWPAAPRGSWRQRRRAHADRPAGSRPPPPGAPAPRPAGSRSA